MGAELDCVVPGGSRLSLRPLWISTVTLALALALGCESTPESDCRSQAGEGGIAIDCPRSEDDWTERRQREAREGFEERGPGSRL